MSVSVLSLLPPSVLLMSVAIECVATERGVAECVVDERVATERVGTECVAYNFWLVSVSASVLALAADIVAPFPAKREKNPR